MITSLGVKNCYLQNTPFLSPKKMIVNSRNERNKFFSQNKKHKMYRFLLQSYVRHVIQYCQPTRFKIPFFISHKALVNCGDPGSLLNGQKRGSRYWTGESVSFICNPGYRLFGPTTRMCLPSGKWSGLKPFCVGERTQCFAFN